VDARTASGGTAWGLLLILGKCARKFFWALDQPPRRTSGAASQRRV